MSFPHALQFRSIDFSIKLTLYNCITMLMPDFSVKSELKQPP